MIGQVMPFFHTCQGVFVWSQIGRAVHDSSSNNDNAHSKS